ncbi:tRNA (adenosine(37)-N6)-threonylcarbamoyltransferase complex ATPase subunit type 1 TsaE [Planctomycetales bacterium]|nr:tRNA (adenosine(37)-N6)-threonylcarbamoyltransferase complex ATPase subunit type 1 TsaE [Planctomycetales bacterium]GHS97111.1 tRNA (adenosine(37)-N6)-threonylcarbamoyltransferase complex ATPase subunit type 1 TsaE [Planctomycetales bacterium]GHT03909.1 tRNA (adenosine(37)-N6)-threonylcarbamoyltransferase complex ATPase subunit type 1 TsaE [Planctomycetales bacterium]
MDELMQKQFTTTSPAQTRALGKRLAAACRGGEVFLLSGDLGAGKTCLTQGLAAGLAIAEPVTSPTFVTHQEYRGARGLTLEHFDFYRLRAGGDEFADFFNRPDCVCALEWAQMLAPILPPEHLSITLEIVAPRRRRIVIETRTPSGEEFLARIE